MTPQELRWLCKYYEGDKHVPNFGVGFDEGFYKALDFMNVKIENVKIPENWKEFMRRKHEQSQGKAET